MQTLYQFLKDKPKGYIAQIADYTWETYSRLSTITAKLRKNEKLNATEAEIMMRWVSLLEGTNYDVTMFKW